MKSVVLLGVLSISALCTAYSSLQAKIPNGNNVPNPCNPDDKWQGVGHKNHLGGGARNPFGVDFKANNLVWDTTICNKDSDNDGRSNGEELGDPACNWSEGQTPSLTSGLSHPGICEPLNSPQCGAQNSWMECGNTGFDCPVVNDVETFDFTVRMPEQQVPAVETTFMCMSFEFPTDKKYHMVANRPHIDNREVMHHTLLYGCHSPPHTAHNTPYMCDMGADPLACPDIIGLWAVGQDGECLHSQTGFPIGGETGYKYGAFQFHWNNPEQITDYVDSSGMVMYLTPNLRPHNAGILSVGQSFLEIPPGRDTTVEVGRCSGQCTRDMITDEIYISSVFNHMHYLGYAQITELRRNDRTVSMLAEDPNYDYNSPVTYSYTDAITVLPGDEIKTTCVFTSKNQNRTTYYGDNTSDEMCIAFIQYFPKERMNTGGLNTGACFNWKTLDYCEFEKPSIQGCDTAEIYDWSNPKAVAVRRNIEELCSPIMCRLECLNYVKELKKTPCYRGDVYDLQKASIGLLQNETSKLQAYKYYASVDSCDVDILRMTFEGSDETSAASIMTPGCALLLSLFALGYCCVDNLNV